jgi:hypothetical protein
MPISPATRGNRGYNEKRREDRSRLTLAGRLYFPDRALEDVCQIVDFSPSGACLKSTASAPVGTRLVLYADAFGRYEGFVAWRHRTVLGMEFRCSKARRTRTAEQLTSFIASGGKLGQDLRRTARLRQSPNLREIVTSQGEHVACEVVNIALGGAALKSSIRPEIGEVVHFGDCSGRVIRHSSVGFVVEFSTTISASSSGAPTAPGLLDELSSAPSK